MSIKVSIIVPVYKVEDYIHRCMNSLLSQNFSSYEIILVDDGSPDNCGVICDNYAKQNNHVKVIHKSNGGLSSARNAGLLEAHGDYVFFVDSDDWISSDAISTLYSIASKSNADIVSGSYVIAKDERKIRDSKNNVTVYSRDQAMEFYLKTGMSNIISEYPAWSKLYKRNLFDDIQFPQGQLYEDVATVFKLIKKSSIYAKTEKVIYYYFRNSSSITHNKFKVADLDAIKVGKQLVRETKQEKRIIQKYAYQKQVRGYFSVLCKIAMYGCDASVNNEKDIISKCIDVLKANYWVLAKSEMPLSRKLILTGLCINHKIVFTMFKIIRRR